MQRAFLETFGMAMQIKRLNEEDGYNFKQSEAAIQSEIYFEREKLYITNDTLM